VVVVVMVVQMSLQGLATLCRRVRLLVSYTHIHIQYTYIRTYIHTYDARIHMPKQ